MTRLLAYRIAPELAALWLVELVALFMTLHLVQITVLSDSVSSLSDQASSINRAALMASVLGVTALGVGLYRADVCLDRRRTMIGAGLAALLGWAVLVGMAPVMGGAAKFSNPLALARVPLIWLLWLTLTRGALGWALRQRLFVRRILILGGGSRAQRLGEMLRTHRSRMFEIIGASAMPTQLTPETLRRERIWAVVVAEEESARVPREHLLSCKIAGIRVSEAAEFCENQLGRIDLEAVGQNWALTADGIRASPPVAVLRRLGDIGISLVLLCGTLPLMLITALLVRLDSPGPMLYRQERTGLGGKTFVLLKFRSMRTDAEAPGKAQWATTNDPRITRIGHFIRRTRIDELPQLLNILRGEMSFIGPRPERPEFVRELSRQIPLYAHRDCVKPGLTGWAQVSFPYGASVDDARHKLSYDLYYIKHRSMLLDLLILVATVRVILFREGAR